MKASQTAFSFNLYHWPMVKKIEIEAEGTAIKDLRVKRGFNQAEFARLIGMSKRRLIQVEKNENIEGLALGFLMKMSAILNAKIYVPQGSIVIETTKPPTKGG